MKIYSIKAGDEIHVAVEGKNGLVDATNAGLIYTLEEIISGKGMDLLRTIAGEEDLMPVENPVYAPVAGKDAKLLCIGLNYAAHAEGMKDEIVATPTIFSKFSNALAASGSDVFLPPWEETYDYEAELVAVIGKKTWNVGVDRAMDCIFGYTCGNDLSCRSPQKRSSQWLIGKTMPGFAPCGPCIVTKDSFNPYESVSIRSYVNGELRQDGRTSDMLYGVAELISYASRYVCFEPGDLIFTGTPSGVVMEKVRDERVWLKAGDTVDVVIDGIGTLTNRFVGEK